MRKRIIGPDPGEIAAAEPGWLDLEHLAQVEITSEEVGYSIESALLPRMGSGWQAAQPGEQTIRLRFDAPLKIKLIRLVFHEDEQERTQEFVLRWSSDSGQSYREIVRQQYNFSPPAASAGTRRLRRRSRRGNRARIEDCAGHQRWPHSGHAGPTAPCLAPNLRGLFPGVRSQNLSGTVRPGLQHNLGSYKVVWSGDYEI